MTSRMLPLRASICVLAVLAVCWPCSVSAGTKTAKDPPAEWHPESEFAGRFDWIQMTSGEWVKGKIVAMYDGDLEFDSDEFDTLILGWNKIKQIRTSQVVNLGLLGRRSVVGTIVLVEGKITAYGDQVEEFDKSDVLTVTAGAPKEINFWTMKVFAGVILRTGNTDVREFSVLAGIERRTIRNRIILDFVLNQNTTEGVEVSSNQRISTRWDTFINDRVFVTPIFGEYFRDPFQNIGARYTVGVAVGYQLIDSPRFDWTIAGGPAHQETRFDSVPAGQDDTESTPALVVSTSADWDITKWLELDGTYRIQVVNETSGTYNHHMVVSFETTITKLIDFHISWIWDRIQNPRRDASGMTPEQDDFRTTVGLSFEF